MSKSTHRKLSPVAGPTAHEKFVEVEFARKLHQILIEKGMSPSDLARKMYGETETIVKRGGKTVYDADGNPKIMKGARHRAKISRWLKGSLPEPVTMKQLADTLGVDPMELGPEIRNEIYKKDNSPFELTVIDGEPAMCILEVRKKIPTVLAMNIGQQLAAWDAEQAEKNAAVSNPN